MNTQHDDDVRLLAKIAAEEKKKMAHKRRMNAKMTFALCVFLLIMAGLLARIGYIIYVHGAKYSEITLAATEIAQMANAKSPGRGVIVDRNKERLAVSASVFRVILDVRLLADADQSAQANGAGKEQKSKSERTFERLCVYMGLSLDYLRASIARNPDGSLVNDTHWYDLGLVKYATAMKIDADSDIYNVFLIEELERKYVHKNLASQVIGFIRGENMWGIEKFYNTYLSNNDDLTQSAAKNQGEIKSGSTVVTTLDYRIQQFAQTACDKMLADYPAQNTAVIIMNPQTGEVLGMAQSPSFDANEPSGIKSINDVLLQINWDALSSAEKNEALNRVWNNYNVVSTFEPGSIFKPMVIAAALEEGIITPDSPASYFCSGSKTFAQWPEPIKCHNTFGHGQQSLDEVLSNSCNVAMMEIGERLGRDLFYKYQRDFGFGEKTGIDLPAEISASNLIYSTSDLGPVQLATSSFGQGFTCTPIQAINAFAAVINGGNLMKPYVVSQVLDVYGNVKYQNEPTVVRKVISKETSDYLRTTLVKVVSNGTGRKAAVEGYNIGGKTGTGQQGIRDEEKYTVSFIAYLPAENPQILAMTLINKPRDYVEGSTSAAPALKEEVLLKLIDYLNIKPNAAVTEKPDAAANALDNYIGLAVTDAIARLNTEGLTCEIQGSGGDTVTNQFPPEGSDKSAVNMVFLTVETLNNEALITVPDLTKVTLPEAQFAASASGFVPVSDETNNFTRIDRAADSDTDAASASGALIPSGANLPIVTRQAPRAGVRLPSGTQIKLFFD